MNILVTGGAGFIGSNLSKKLLGLGHTVTVYDDLSTGKLINLPDNVTFIEADVRNYDTLLDACKGQEYVFHLAAIPSVTFSVEHPEKTHNVNINGTLNVLRASKKQNVKKVIFASSSSVYGESLLPTFEIVRPNPQSPYALQKVTGEMYCRIFDSIYNLPTVSLRFFNVYGSGQNPDLGVLARFKEAKKQNKPLTIIGNGTQTRDFVHIHDVCAALIKAMENTISGIEINIGSGKSYSINEVAALFNHPIEYLPDRGEIKHTLADIQLAKSILNWYPTISLETYA